MRVLLLAGAIGALLVGGAVATAGSKPNYWRIVDRSVAAKWSGPYAGLSLGYGWSRYSASNAFASSGAAPVPHQGFTASRNGFGAGVTAGYNFYASNVVFGVEADLTYSGRRFRPANLNFSDVAGPGDTLSADFSSRLVFLSTVRGRLGYLLDPQTLVYATGGLAAARSSARLAYSYDDGTGPMAGTAHDTRNRFGWVAGIGIEDRFTDNLSMKLEYLYVSLPGSRFRFTDPAFTVGVNGAHRFHIVQVGINYHF